MKNFTLGLNIVLVVAVAVLFYLHFSSSKKTLVTAADKQQAQAAGGFKVAYFEMDSLETKFEFWKDAREELKKLDQSKTNEVAERRNQYKSLIMKYQQQQQAGKMTKDDAERASEDVMQAENALKAFEQEKAQEMQNESVVRMQSLKKKIEDFLKKYNEGSRYSYILSATPEMMYYKDTTYNITNDLLKGLNDQYKEEKKKK